MGRASYFASLRVKRAAAGGSVRRPRALAWMRRAMRGHGGGEKTASSKRCGGADRRGKPDTASRAETRKSRKHGQLRGYRRREASTSGRSAVRGKGLAPQVKQTLPRSRDSLAKSLIRNGVLKIEQHGLHAHRRSQQGNRHRRCMPIRCSASPDPRLLTIMEMRDSGEDRESRRPLFHRVRGGTPFHLTARLDVHDRIVVRHCSALLIDAI